MAKPTHPPRCLPGLAVVLDALDGVMIYDGVCASLT
jgi:hypothetical protein